MKAGAAPKRSAMYGTSGTRMPKPSVSMMQKRNSAASCPRTFSLSQGLWAGTSADTSGLGGAGGV